MGWTWWSLGNRPAWFPVVACLSGVAAGPALEAPVFWWGLLSACGLGLAIMRGHRAGGVLGGLVAAFGLGAALAVATADVTEPPLNQRVVLVGEVERVGPHGFTLDVWGVNGVPARFKASLSVEDAPTVLPGQWVQAETKLGLVQPAANPGEWSRATWAWRRGQPVAGAVLGVRLVQRSAPSAWRRWLEAAQASLAHDTRAISEDAEATALLLTLSAGQRAELGESLEDAFARSGLAHVLSVSGLHVAVLALTVFAALRWLLSRRMRTRWRLVDPRAFAAPMSLPVVWGYVVFTGWQAPAVRSALMCSLLLGAWIVRRRSDALNALAVAAGAMVVVDPAAPFDLSVQLSFLAVLALVLLAPLLRAVVPLAPPSPATQTGWTLRLARWREAAVQTFTASLAVTVTTAPLVLMAFQRVSLAGLVSNVVTLPLSGVLTIVAAAGAAVHLVSPLLSLPVLWAGVQLARVFVVVAQVFARVPGGTAELPMASGPVLVAWWGGLAALVFARGPWRWLAASAPAALAWHVGGANAVFDLALVGCGVVIARSRRPWVAFGVAGLLGMHHLAPGVPGAVLAIVAVAAVWVSPHPDPLPRWGEGGRWVVSALVLGLVPLGVERPASEVSVTFLSVGHGDAVVISSRGQHALIDGGGVPQGHDTGERFVLPFLKQRRVERLELAVLTHQHPDHALGLISTLEAMPTKRLWLHAEPGEGPIVSDLVAAAKDAVVEEKQAGDEGLRLGDAELEVLGPPAERATLDGENDQSLVLRVRHGAVSFLLTGDVEEAAEGFLAPGEVTVMKAPHHGSDTSSTAAFVERTRPKHVVFCVGRNNRFDFPRAEVVRRWEAVGARCYRTDVDGAVTFTSDGKDVNVETFRPRERRARR